MLGQTYPNRRYLLGATSLGQIDDTPPALTDYPPDGTIFDRLDAHGITWKNYYSSASSLELFPPLYVKGLAAGKVVKIAGVGEEFAAQVINAVINGPPGTGRRSCSPTTSTAATTTTYRRRPLFPRTPSRRSSSLEGTLSTGSPGTGSAFRSP